MQTIVNGEQKFGPGKRNPLRDRFEAKVERLPVECGCWIWTGSTSPAGYGQIRTGKGKGYIVMAHRLAYELYRGEIPEGLQVLHTVCDLPSCVNPWHMTLGTQKDNQTEMSLKGRGRKSEHGRPYGVSYDGRKEKPWAARISRREGNLWFGYYATQEEASEVVQSALEMIRRGEQPPVRKRLENLNSYGTYQVPGGRYVARVCRDGVKHYVATFDTSEAAGLAVEKFLAKYSHTTN